MGAPPGAPGAINGTPRVRQNTTTLMLQDGRGGTGNGYDTPCCFLANSPIVPIPHPLGRAGATQGNPTTLFHALRNIHSDGITAVAVVINTGF